MDSANKIQWLQIFMHYHWQHLFHFNKTPENDTFYVHVYCNHIIALHGLVSVGWLYIRTSVCSCHRCVISVQWEDSGMKVVIITNH